MGTFETLPPEIRLMIFRYLLCPGRLDLYHDWEKDGVSTEGSGGRIPWTYQIAEQIDTRILRISRENYELASNLLYGHNKFVFHFEAYLFDDRSDIGFFQREFLGSLSRLNRERLKDIEIFLDTFQNLNELDDFPYQFTLEEYMPRNLEKLTLFHRNAGEEPFLIRQDCIAALKDTLTEDYMRELGQFNVIVAPRQVSIVRKKDTRGVNRRR